MCIRKDKRIILIVWEHLKSVVCSVPATAADLSALEVATQGLSGWKPVGLWPVKCSEVMFCKCIFPHFQNLKAGEIPQPDFPDDYNLGDIFLGVEFIFQQCKEDEDYYDILTVSGMLK